MIEGFDRIKFSQRQFVDSSGVLGPEFPDCPTMVRGRSVSSTYFSRPSFVMFNGMKIGNGLEMRGGEINPTELVATLINQGSTFEEGIQKAQNAIEGSCSLLLLTDRGIYAARDRLGRTPIIVGAKEGSYAATLETCAFPNLDYKIEKYLGPGEIVLITEEGVEQKVPPGNTTRICGFLWVYYGYPASNYEYINVEK